MAAEIKMAVKMFFSFKISKLIIFQKKKIVIFLLKIQFGVTIFFLEIQNGG
jgi:hypothetical protein